MRGAIHRHRDRRWCLSKRPRTTALAWSMMLANHNRLRKRIPALVAAGRSMERDEAMQLDQKSDGPRTLYDKIWDSHRVMSRDDGQDLLFIDRHFIHDVTAQSFDLMRQR